ncbi:MAG TPA: DUF433 domain-containing protein [Candidatus Binataceae bacterium]|nr:DUF433 domain-containing protein [Candidatus Binataceae bacterium]
MPEQETYTPAEAAAVAGLPIKTVQKAIDEGPFSKARKRNGRSLRAPDLLYLVTIRNIDTRIVKLSTPAKAELLRKLDRWWNEESSVDLAVGGLLFQAKSARRELRTRLSKLQQAQRMVVSDPEIRGGLPIIKGTRIGVHEIAAMLDQGETEADLLEGYPALKRQQLELARIYAAAYPRRGRPPRHPWHAAEARQA